MTNHLHLLIKMGESPLDEIFQTVHMKYAKYFNEKRDTEGHVFQGRPGMKIIFDRSYLRDLCGYLHRNPVEAGMVETVQDYQWSSWHWFFYGEIPELRTGQFPPGFNQNPWNRFREVIRDVFEVPEGEHFWRTKEEWDQLDKREEGRGGRKYRERRALRSMSTVVNEIVGESEYSLSDLKSQRRDRDLSKVRQTAIKELYEEGYNPTEIGKFFNRTPSAVNYARKQVDNLEE